MAIQIGRFEFEGPFLSPDRLEDRAGVYAVLTSNGGVYNPVDVGESAQVKTRVAGHDRADCWLRHAISGLAVAVLYTPGLQQAGRRRIEQELRQQFAWPCGER